MLTTFLLYLGCDISSFACLLIIFAYQRPLTVRTTHIMHLCVSKRIFWYKSARVSCVYLFVMTAHAHMRIPYVNSQLNAQKNTIQKEMHGTLVAKTNFKIVINFD